MISALIGTIGALGILLSIVMKIAALANKH